MKQTAELLKQAREKSNLSLSEVSMATKISTRILKALEENEMDKLPAKTFIRGFVRTYAEYLKADVDHILEIFYEEMGSTQPKAKSLKEELLPEETIVAPIKQKNKPSNSDEKKEAAPSKKLSLPFLNDTSLTGKIVLVSALFVLIGLIILVRNIANKYEQERNSEIPAEIADKIHPINPPTRPENKVLEKIKPTNRVEQKAISADAAPKVEEIKKVKMEKKVQVLAKPGTVEVSNPPNNETSQTELNQDEQIKKLPPVKLEAQSTAQKKPIEKPKELAVVSTENSVKTSDQPSPIKEIEAVTQEVILQALDKVDIAYKVDGNKKMSLQLKPQTVHIIKAKQSVSLDISDAGLIQVIHNGIDKGPAGNLGEAKTLKFP